MRTNIKWWFILTMVLASAAFWLKVIAFPVPSVNEDARLDRFRNYFMEQFWKIHPADAIYSGYHKNDSLLVVPDKAFFASQIQLLNTLKDSLNKYDLNKLSANFKTDYYMMRDRIETDLWYINEFKEFEWNPSWYNIGGEFAEILNGSYANLDNRLMIISSRLQNTRAYFDAAKSNLNHTTIEHTDLGIQQSEGSLEVFGQTLQDSISKSGLDEANKKILRQRIESTKDDITQYVAYLKNMRQSMTIDNSRSFRIGRTLYFEKFKHDINSRYTAQEVFQKAKDRKDWLNSEMAKLSKKLWPKYMGKLPVPTDEKVMIKQVIDKISVKHCQPDSFIASIKSQIPELIAFIKRKDLIYLDPTKPLVVRQTPPWMEGSGAGASVSSPGPYDPGGNTYYNVSPLTGYSPEQAESYLREYNNYILQILNIHEAIPGHYTQLIYANKSPSIIKSVLGNGAMIEGWAVYSEYMMLEQGYGNNEPEMWLMYYKWNLRSVCNTILDYSVHVENMSEKDAINFLTNEAFQQQAEAAGKWRRVKLSQVQLCSYFTGFNEIYELREEIKKAEATSFNLKQFHEKFLSYGSAPVKYIRELMTIKN